MRDQQRELAQSPRCAARVSSMFDHFPIETGIEETASKGAAAAAAVDTGFDTTPVTATVSPALAPAPETVDTGFGDLGVTTAPVQPAAPRANTVAGKGKPEDLDARVAALPPKKSTTNWNAISVFMANVVPWPGSPTDPGYVNLHFGLPDDHSSVGTKKKYKGVPGWPYKDPSNFVTRLDRMLKNPGKFTDIWYCLSLQKDKGTNKRGDPKAIRLKANAIGLKAIWVDIDIKDDPKCYQTQAEALKAILDFQRANLLPEPSAIVFSGGGIHVYWISKTTLLPHEWDPFAHGLKALLISQGIKCDAGLTTDSARILRVPGTKNYKYDPPREVQLANLPLRMYDFPTQLSMLPPLAGQIKTPSATPAFSLFAEGADLDSFKNPPPWSFPDEPGLDAGIDRFADFLVDPRPIFKDCGFYRDAFANGGTDHKQDLWMYGVLGATFMENGRAYAHEISKGHASYTPDETDAMFDRKVADRHDRGLGYPQCSTIQGAGCKACRTCPLLGKLKSPLNIRPVVTATADATSDATPQSEPSFADPGAEFVDPHKTSPVSVLMALHGKGADLNSLFLAMNQTFAVVRYGTQILVATIGDDICLMKVEDFHKMLANIVVPVGNKEIAVSRLWFKWEDRRQYPGAGVVFQPGGPPEIKGDMLNLWRGFGIKPMPGNWSLLRDHIFKEVCSGRQDYFDYLINWMAYAVQHPDRPMGVAVAFLGAQGAGKGIVARTFGKFFGKHFAHIANGEQLTGRFNASIGMSCVVFLDEALWAGDKKGEGVLKALITEPSLQLEAKFRDPIRVENRLRIVVASNNDWAVPAGIGDRRWFVLNVADTYSGMAHQGYWNAVYNQIDGGGAAAMLHDLLSMDVSAFNVRAVPHTAAKASQQVHSLHGSLAWLHDVLQEGSIGGEQWQDAGLTIETDRAYMCYVEFSKRQRDWKPEIKAVWSKNIRAALDPHIHTTRPTKGATRVREFQFAPLDDCRRQFASHLCAPDLEWEAGSQPDNQSEEAPEGMWDCDDPRLDAVDAEWEPETDPEPEYEAEDGPLD